MSGATTSVALGRAISVVASPAKKKFHELNPHMLSSKALNQGNDLLTSFFQVLYMGLYALANVVFVCIPFAIDYAVSRQPAVVKKAEKQYESTIEKTLKNLISLERERTSYSTDDYINQVNSAKLPLKSAFGELLIATQLLEEGKPAPAPARAQVKKAERELKKKIREIEKELKTLDNFILDVEVDFLHEADYKKQYDLGASLDRIKGERVKIKERLNHAKDNLAEFNGLRAAPTPAPISDEDSFLPPGTILEGEDF